MNFRVGVFICFLGLLHQSANAQYTLTILHNNDGESKLLNTSSPPPDFGGAARFKALVDAVRGAATTDGVVTLSSGDNFLAGPEFNASLTSGMYFDAKVLDAVGYDAVILGNHEFDFGPSVLADVINATTGSYKFLSANLDFAPDPDLAPLAASGRLGKSTVLEKGGEKIGIIGATTPLLPTISSPGLVGINPDLVSVIQAEIDALEAAGVNKIILVSHLQSVAEDKALIPLLRGVDVAISGGGDDLLANPGDNVLPGGVPVGPYPTVVNDVTGTGVPIVTTAGEYNYLGKLEVTFDASGNLTAFSGKPLRVIDATSTNILPGDVPVTPDAGLVTDVVNPVAASIAGLAANIIADNDARLDGRRTSVRTKETNYGNLIADSFLWDAQNRAAGFGVDTPSIAFQNGGGIRNNGIVGPGNYSELDTFAALPFANFLTVVPDVSGATLKALMENAVSRVAFVDGRFAQIAGYQFTYDPLLAPGNRIRSLSLDDGTVVVHNGLVVDPTFTVDIATIDFLATGGDSYDWNGSAPGRSADRFVRLGTTYQRSLYDYVVDGRGGKISASDYPFRSVGRIGIVPEPASMILAGCGAAGLFFFRRRQKTA